MYQWRLPLKRAHLDTSPTEKRKKRITHSQVATKLPLTTAAVEDKGIDPPMGTYGCKHKGLVDDAVRHQVLFGSRKLL